MTEKEIKQIEDRCEAATEGEWKWNVNLKNKCVADIPRLIAYVRELEGRVKELEE